jgi:hypothetical protein
MASRRSSLRLERVPLEQCDWEALDALPDRVLFQTRPWLDFLEQSQSAEPVVAALLRDDAPVGWFTGAIVRRAGVKILGSPFPGWSTHWMGFNLIAEVDRWEACEALAPFAFKGLGCLHVEVCDRRLTVPSDPSRGWSWQDVDVQEIDLTPSEEEIKKGMWSLISRHIKKSEKLGVVVEYGSGEGFADEYYAQLEDVFEKQSLRPTYDVERVRALIRCLEPHGALLLLRALSADGVPIATGIFPGGFGTAYFWGGASWREHQQLRPNDAVFWRAIREWKQRGATVLDLGGGEYKQRYGPVHSTVPQFRRSRLPGMASVRSLAETIKRRGY